MCGRYSLILTATGLRQRFQVKPPDGWEPTPNAAPGMALPILSAEIPDAMVLAHWGYRPSWAGIDREMINARGETVAEKPFFRQAFAKHRVLIPADGFYEWGKTTSDRHPFRIVRTDDEPFLMAGLATPRDDGQLGFAIITTDAADPVRQIHDRSPVMISISEKHEWLDPARPISDVTRMLKPLRDGILRMYPVSTELNRAANQDLHLIDPIHH